MRVREPLCVHVERPPGSAFEAGAGAVEPLTQLAEVGDDQPCRSRRRRGANVGGEVAERRVLLVADRGDDRHRAARDRPNETLVAERQQVLEAAAATGDHDHVEPGHLAQAAQRVDDRRRGARALDVGLRDDDVRRREARLDPGEDVPLRGGVVAGDEADRARPDRQGPLSLGCEQPLRRQLRLQPLQRRQVIAEPEALQRERAQPELASRRVELGPAVGVDAVAVGKLEP